MNTMLNERELKVYIGKQIRAYRERSNMTQEQLGKKIKKSANTVSNYETGLSTLTQDTLFQLASIFDVSVDDFFPGNPSKEFNRSMEITKEKTKDLRQMLFLKNLIQHVNKLDSEERELFFDTVEAAIEFSKKVD